MFFECTPQPQTIEKEIPCLSSLRGRELKKEYPFYYFLFSSFQQKKECCKDTGNSCYICRDLKHKHSVLPSVYNGIKFNTILTLDLFQFHNFIFLFLPVQPVQMSFQIHSGKSILTQCLIENDGCRITKIQ